MASAPRGATNLAGSPSAAPRAKVYQIDFTAIASGKRIASSKRRVRWRFGFANPEALANGETGTACRGEEHDVTLVWSITSGKRLVLADGQEVHYSSSRSSIFDFSWTMRGNHVLKIVAHASPPLSPTPGFRQYDFFVDGQTFFSFPKVFRLGLNPNDPRGAPAPSSPSSPAHMAERGQRYNSHAASQRSSGIANLEVPGNPDEEEAYLQEAIRQSLEDDGPPEAAGGGSPASAGGVDLLDFGSAPTPAALPPSTTTYDQFGVPVADPFGGGGGQQQAPAPQLALPPSTTHDPYASYGSLPPTAAGDPFASNGSILPAAAPVQESWPALPVSTNAPPPQPSQNGYYGQQQSVAASAGLWAPPPPAAAGSYAPAGPWTAPAPIVTQPPPQQQQYPGAQPFGFQPDQVPPSVSPQAQQTPSTLGFQSPAPDFGGFSATPAQPTPSESSDPTANAAAASAGPIDPALLTMNTLSGHERLVDPSDNAGTGKSMAEQAYAKLVNMDTFSLVSKNDAEERHNPFEMASSTSMFGVNASLADIQSKKADAPRKEVMKSHAMVVSETQNGAYGAQYGFGGGMQQQQQPAYGGGMMGQQQPFSQQQQPAYGAGAVMGQQQPFSQQQYGQPPQQYGQPPAAPQPGQYQAAPPPQQYQAQPPFGQAPPPQQQQQQQPWGQPPPQQAQYGQPGFY